jgi:integrase
MPSPSRKIPGYVILSGARQREVEGSAVGWWLRPADRRSFDSASRDKTARDCAQVRAIIEGALDRYVGSTQVHLIGDELWGGYPAWRRVNGAGRNKRNGVREVSEEMAQTFADNEAERRTKVQQTLGIRVLKPIEVKPSEERTIPFISDSTIRFEMSIFGAVMNYAIKKRYVSASQRFDERPKLKTMRRDEFTLEEYRKLHTVGRKWIGETDKPSSVWYRTVTYNMILISCNTGMRPAEMKNLRWRASCPQKTARDERLSSYSCKARANRASLLRPRVLEIIWNASAPSPKQRNQRIESLPTSRASPQRLFTTH